MKRSVKNILWTAFSAMLVMSFASCDKDKSSGENDNQKKLDLTGYEVDSSLSDEFEGDSLNTEKWWVYTGQVYNNEKQTYLDDGSTVEVSDGILKLKAYKKNNVWYSGKIQASDRMPFKYGYVEASLKLPGANGVWPAFWMMPQSSVYGGWPSSGEIDIMEYSPSVSGSKTYATIHKNSTCWNKSSHLYPTLGNLSFASQNTAFHRYGLLWTEKTLEAYYDGISLGIVYENPYDGTETWNQPCNKSMKPLVKQGYIVTVDDTDTYVTYEEYEASYSTYSKDREWGFKYTSDGVTLNTEKKYEVYYSWPYAWPFDQEFYVILNLAMGGDLGGNIDSTLTEATYEVDYVRVYKPSASGED